MATQFGYPYRVDRLGRTAGASPDDHVRDLIEQVLFTSPGERVNRPTFGTGLQQLVFAPNSQELASAVGLMVQGALQKYLGHLLQVEDVSVVAQDATLSVTVTYTLLRTRERQVATFEQGT